MNSRCRTGPSRRAFTLIEMALVLAIIVAVAALSWPTLRSGLEKGQLREAARQVRAEWGRARHRAMETGSPHQFLYQPGRGLFLVAPCSGDRLPAGSIELPDGTYFCHPEVAVESAATRPARRRAAEEDWSEPILFFPDGSTSDSSIRVGSKVQATIEVTLRGLTGTALISELRWEDDWGGTGHRGNTGDRGEIMVHHE